MKTISLIVCTTDHERLDTLGSSLALQERVEGVRCELLISHSGVPNRRTDLPISIQQLPSFEWDVMEVFNPAKGQSRARNSAMDAAAGCVIAWTDDDTAPRSSWLKELCTPLLLDRRSPEACDVTSGYVRVADELHRDWMTDTHLERLASSTPSSCESIVGANMAFRREALRSVPSFDARLGPGALGFGDDTLFGLQLHLAGFVHRYVKAAEVVHHFDPRRLEYGSWLDSADRMAASFAYIDHHWRHLSTSCLYLRYINMQRKIAAYRLLHNRRQQYSDEGISLEELKLQDLLCYYKHLLNERFNRRAYSRFGLTTLTSSYSASELLGKRRAFPK